MGVSKVTLNTPTGEEVVVDFSNDTVTAETLLSGYTAHGADGEPITGMVTGAPQKTVHTMTSRSEIRYGGFSYGDTTISFIDDRLWEATPNCLYHLIPGHTYTVSLSEYVSTIKFCVRTFNFPGAEDMDFTIPKGAMTQTTTTFSANGTIEKLIDTGWVTVSDGYTFTATEKMNLMNIIFHGNSIGEFVNFHQEIYGDGIADNYSITEEWDIDGTADFRRRLIEGATIYFEIPEGTTLIRRGAFYHQNKLIDIKIPDSVTTIDAVAFFGCNELRLDKLPPNLTGKLDDQTFFLCYRLRISEIPAGVTSIGNGTFAFCEDMPTVTFKGTPTSIHSNAFQNCTRITTINVPWAEGAVSGAPWGATNATINYNYTG